MFLKIFVLDNVLYLTTPDGTIVSKGDINNTVFDIVDGFVGSVHENTKAYNVSIATSKGEGKEAGWYSASMFKDKSPNIPEKGQFTSYVCKASADFVKTDGTSHPQGVFKAGFSLPKLGGGSDSNAKVTIPTVKTGKTDNAIVIEPKTMPIVPVDF